MPIITIEQAIEDFKAGKFVIIVDDEDRENEGDLAIAADRITAEAINFMATHGRGLICTPMEASRLDELQIEPMVGRNTAPLGTAFTVSVEARHRVTTGISAEDRANTVKALIDPASKPVTSPSPATRSRCAPARAACWCAPARPRPPSTWPASPGSTRPG